MDKNEVERAIKTLKVRSGFVADINLNAIMAYKLAIEALEKQLPKKPLTESYMPTLCPTCEEELSENLGDGYYKISYYLTRCPECGQLLDWEN